MEAFLKTGSFNLDLKPEMNALLAQEITSIPLPIENIGSPSQVPLSRFACFTFACFTPDGSLLARAGFDHNIYLWNLKEGRPAGNPLIGHTYFIRSLCFSPDGSILASVGDDQTIRLWDPKTGKQICKPLKHTNLIRSLCFSPNGSLLASAGDGATICLWDARTEKQVSSLIVGHINLIRSICFRPDSSLIAAAGDDNVIYLWNPHTKKQIGSPLIGHTNFIRSLCFSPDGSILASAGDDQTIRLWNPKTGEQIGEPLRGYKKYITFLCFNSDGSILASIGDGATICLWNTQLGKQVSSTVINYSAYSGILCFKSDNSLLAYTYMEKEDTINHLKIISLTAAEHAILFMLTKQATPSLFLNVRKRIEGSTMTSKLKEHLLTLLTKKEEDYKSPSMFHITRNKADGNKEKFIDKVELMHLFNKFIAKEKELYAKGYYTFIHGQQRKFYFPEKLYTVLWGLRKQQSVDNFFFAHVKDLVETETDKEEHDILRQCLQWNGTQWDSESYSIDEKRRELVLFMNYAFFANLQNRGSHSPDYIKDNDNSPTGKKIQVSAEDPFIKLGYAWIYKKHAQEIEDLAADYAQLCPFGNALLIAIPKETINEYAYLAQSGGPRRHIEIKGIGTTCDTKLILETLLNEPKKIENNDELEFCLIMTQHKGGLDPSTGIQIHPILSGDPQKLKELKEREDALFAKIKADIEADEKDRALKRAAILVNQVIEPVKEKPNKSIAGARCSIM